MSKHLFGTKRAQHPKILKWVEETAKLCQPNRVFWCDGSGQEKEYLLSEAVSTGVLRELNPDLLPRCFYHRSDPNDVARVEECTFICTPAREDAGPINNWAPPEEMDRKLRELFRGSMRGRTLYVVPYLMGPPGSPLTKVGIELTDSVYVAISMGIMTRMGTLAYSHVNGHGSFNRGLHSVLDLDPKKRFICHFPQDNAVLSTSSNYGGNVLLGKKCLSLRIGSYLARQEGWLAEHMLIVSLQSPAGEKSYLSAAFPSACGKTNLAMLVPPPPFQNWKVTTVGDDIAWIKPAADGRLFAINPEAGYFGVAPGTNPKSNPNAMQTISHDTVYTNVALLPNGDVWWEGKNGEPPKECFDWKGHIWTPTSKEKAAHPNSRFTAPMTNNPAFAPEANDPAGVPINAILFGGRRATTVPLVVEAFDWEHGVYLGATMSSEMTAAAAGVTGHLRRDPMAMLPFCGYDMGQYFQHWLEVGKTLKNPPRIFHVNWFRQKNGKYLWPGFGQNMRVLKWIIDRCQGRVGAVRTALGWMPRWEDMDFEGLPEFSKADFDHLQRVDKNEWRKEIESQEQFFARLRATLPHELLHQKESLRQRLESGCEVEWL